MLWLLANTALAQDAAWTPTTDSSSVVGHRSLLRADFDGDGVTDLATELLQKNGLRAIDVLLGTGKEVFVEMPLDLGTMDLYAIDVDDDGVDELMVSFPDLDDGKVAIFAGSALGNDLDSWEDEHQLYFAEGSGSAFSRFGYDIEVLDLTGDGNPELLFGAPDEGRVYLFSYEKGGDVRSSDAAASWTGFVGWAIEPIDDRDGDAVPELAFAACSDADCGRVSLQVVSGADLQRETELDPLEAVGAFSGLPVALQSTRDHDGDGFGEVAWLTENVLTVLNPEVGVLTERAASGGLALLETGDATGDGLDDLWAAFDGEVVLYSDVVEDTELARFAVVGEVLGHALVGAGDQNGDGCDDALATASDGTIYLLASSCTTDTGVETDSDSGTDSGTETGVETDSGTETGTGETAGPQDSTPDTSNPVVCEPEFGWGCGSSQAGLFFLILGTLLLRTRE
ncbi:MAG: hypothetical protein GY913_32780 [Proteobacteria bacterium]|nr:hypothetical protein [Pseudomonadota bacterium]MCP4921699.1 hypothetical protein [Pseudomonadota bacterium]